jgi:hypothetical protein
LLPNLKCLFLEGEKGQGFSVSLSKLLLIKPKKHGTKLLLEISVTPDLNGSLAHIKAGDVYGTPGFLVFRESARKYGLNDHLPV